MYENKYAKDGQPLNGILNFLRDPLYGLIFFVLFFLDCKVLFARI